ncbi:MAG: hypothetical protein NZU63_12320 [Gemmataceae bacterium]|nr:hypothetical protein [Gemmataceae bacterium]MDW8241580.1 hypothetical protein [Thermogemmata sp.]
MHNHWEAFEVIGNPFGGGGKGVSVGRGAAGIVCERCERLGRILGATPVPRRLIQRSKTRGSSIPGCLGIETRPERLGDQPFSFAASLNASELTVGDIGGIAKKRWEYLWVHYQDAEDENLFVKQPVAVYVRRV